MTNLYGLNSEILTVLKKIFPDTQKCIDTVKCFKYEVPKSTLPPFPDIHMIFQHFKDACNHYLNMCYLSVNVEPEVIDVIQIRYDTNIDPPKYPEVREYIVLME